MTRSITDPEVLEVRWNSITDYDIHFKRFKRMGALLEWVEKHPNMIVSLAIYHEKKREKELQEMRK